MIFLTIRHAICKSIKINGEVYLHLNDDDLKLQHHGGLDDKLKDQVIKFLL